MANCFLYFQSAQPLVTVFDEEGKSSEQVGMPAVFKAPLCQDILHFVHTNMPKNSRMPHAVSHKVGIRPAPSTGLLVERLLGYHVSGVEVHIGLVRQPMEMYVLFLNTLLIINTRVIPFFILNIA